MDIELPQLVINLLLGGVLGYLAGMLGIGGGLLAMPLFVLVYGMDQQMAHGTALAMMAPNMILGFWHYRQRNPITYRMALSLGVAAVITSYFSAMLAAQISTNLLRQMVAIFMLGLSANLFWQSISHKTNQADRALLPIWLLPLVGVVGGICSGFFTVGAASVTIPLMTGGFGLAQTSAQGLALAMAAPGALVALLAYAKLGFVNWTVAVPVAVGSLLTISHGVALAHRLPENKLRVAFAVALLVSALMILTR